MGSERVVFGNSAPIGINDLLSVFFCTDAVHPVISITKASAGPSEYGYVNSFESFNNVLSHAVYIGDAIFFFDKDSLIDASSQVLGELSVNILVDSSLALFGINYDMRHFILR